MVVAAEDVRHLKHKKLVIFPPAIVTLAVTTMITIKTNAPTCPHPFPSPFSLLSISPLYLYLPRSPPTRRDR